MKTCTECGGTKPLDQFYKNGNYYRSSCKECFGAATGRRVTEYRRQLKLRLVTLKGSRCADCGYQGPPFMFDFDHRDPELKSFQIGGKSVAWETLLAEVEKCDLVCANCHRMRTHKQRCSGCEYC